MTRQSTFKKKVRARMQKTGERYAAARQTLLGDPLVPQVSLTLPVPDGYRATSGVHGDTARLAAALSFSRVPTLDGAEEWNEATVFALTGGIGFMYFLFEYKDTPPLLTLVCRSFSMPWPLIERAINNAQLTANVVETTSAKKAQATLDACLDAGGIAHLTVDHASLPWTGTEEIWAGQMPKQVNVVARDGDVYLVDDGTLREVGGEILRQARAATRKQKHRMITFAQGQPAPPDTVASNVCASTVEVMTKAPFKGYAVNFGLAGLKKAATLTGHRTDKKAWERVFGTAPLAHRALRRLWECIHLDYTPPGAGRAFYALGLRSLAAAVKDKKRKAHLDEAASLAEQSGKTWERLADRALSSDSAVMKRTLSIAEQMDALCREGDAPGDIKALRKEKDALGETFALSDDQRRGVFDGLSSDFSEILEIETQLVAVLEQV